MDMRPEQSLKNRWEYRLADILWHRHFELAELFGSLIWFLWSLSLLNPFAQTFGTSIAFKVMASLAPEWVWGGLAFLLAMNQFGAMMTEIRRWRIFAGGLLFAWGLFIGLMIGFANPSGTGVVIYSSVSLLSLFAFLRSFRETNYAG